MIDFRPRRRMTITRDYPYFITGFDTQRETRECIESLGITQQQAVTKDLRFRGYICVDCYCFQKGCISLLLRKPFARADNNAEVQSSKTLTMNVAVYVDTYFKTSGTNAKYCCFIFIPEFIFSSFSIN